MWRLPNIGVPPGQRGNGDGISKGSPNHPRGAFTAVERVLNHLESIWRDTKIGEICAGANEVQLWSIARIAIGRDITG